MIWLRVKGLKLATEKKSIFLILVTYCPSWNMLVNKLIVMMFSNCKSSVRNLETKQIISDDIFVDICRIFVVWNEKWISISQLVPLLFRNFRVFK